MNYTIDHFINKYEATRESEWTTGVYHSDNMLQHCALGLCGHSRQRTSDEGKALQKLFTEHLGYFVSDVNDGVAAAYPQPTPRQRILAACYEIKKLQGFTIKSAKIEGRVLIAHITY